MEPRPDFIKPEQAKKFGYEVYSCRYGNIYTTRQLLQLVKEALQARSPQKIVWEKNNRYFDALRPSVDPAGYESEDLVHKVRSKHLQAVREMLENLDVFVFTLGLTEAWLSKRMILLFLQPLEPLQGIIMRKSSTLKISGIMISIMI
ncbi:GSCFA domain-containing protein [Vreelandella azerica]|uniref:GSCFA domain-containing protein n=1 Tax=Vreelandella azerica TaxID=2732867 RepID=UPI003BF59F3E